MTSPVRKVIIIGGGISGLSTAFALIEEAQQRDVQVECTVIEATHHWGGKILTHRVDDLIIEGGPDSFLSSKPWALELCTKLGIESQLINTNESQSKTFTYSQGKLREFPQGLIAFVPTKIAPLFKSGLLSWPGIFRMAGDLWLPGRKDPNQDESLAQFFSRRFGVEAFARLIEPLVAGIYAGDAQELSVDATFPRFVELERQHGSLIKSMLAQRKKGGASPQSDKPRRTLFTTLEGGLGDLVAALRTVLQQQGVTFLANTKVAECSPIHSSSEKVGFHITTDQGTVFRVDGLVLATPAYESARLLAPWDSQASELLNQIPYASTATISLAYSREQVERFIKGFGFVVPRIEGKNLIAATWTSVKWQKRAGTDHSLIRCYIGGRGREDILEKTDQELIAMVKKDLEAMVGITSQPHFGEVYRWHKGMPQYLVGHLQRVSHLRKEVAKFRGLGVTGAAFEGIGIPDCIREGSRTALQLAKDLWPECRE